MRAPISHAPPFAWPTRKLRGSQHPGSIAIRFAIAIRPRTAYLHTSHYSTPYFGLVYSNLFGCIFRITGARYGDVPRYHTGYLHSHRTFAFPSRPGAWALYDVDKRGLQPLQYCMQYSRV